MNKYQILLIMESDKELKIDAPEDWGTTEANIAHTLCNMLESARTDDATYVRINNVIVRLENISSAKIKEKFAGSGEKVISFPNTNGNHKQGE